MKKKIFQHIDFILLFTILSLITLGVFFIYSAGVSIDGLSVSKEYIKQIVWASVGFIVMITLSFIDYRNFEKYAGKLFIVLIVLLVLTRLTATKINGARSWLGIGPVKVQPSEFCKILFIIFLAKFLDTSKKYSDLTRFILSVLIFLVPFGLIMIQPDMGTASVFLPILLTMMLFAGIPLRLIMMLFLGGTLTIYFLVLPEWYDKIAQKTIPLMNVLTSIKLRGIIILATGAVCLIGMIGKLIYKENKYFYWIAYGFGIICFSLIFSYAGGKVVKGYQLERLIIFINPEMDPRGAGWQTIKSITAVGSGRLFGEGYLKGNLCHSDYLPEPSTDFIFGTLSEELGFIGGIIVFSLYFILLVRNLMIVRKSTIPFGTYIAAGIFGIFLWHFIENVGMVIGNMPITGIPLLFLSYGGSSLLTAMTCVGLLMSVRARKYDF